MFTLSGCGGWFSGDYCERFFEAKKYGFTAIEQLGWTDVDLAAARGAIDASGVKNSALLFGSRDQKTAQAVSNRHGIVWANARDAFIRSIDETLEAARAIDCGLIVVTTGNERDDVSRDVQHANVVEALRSVRGAVEGSGVKLVLEPLNVLVDHKGYYLSGTDEGIEIIDEVGSPDIMLLYDVYHQQITEGNIINTIRKYISKIGHIHLGDVPGRKEPGTGELNYRNIFKAIADTGYSGYATFECGRTEPVETLCPKMFGLLG